ncbi:MAG: SMP-30/gluconolactonase/LRE family protein [Burkholderiales bacterium]|nr:SMP-30/gluconolactonase/LRE family protein [Burkholderiales bacterium]
MDSEQATSTLSHTDATRGLVPIPSSERDLPTAMAVPFFKVPDAAGSLEGPAFDRHGNLLFLDIYSGRVLRLSPERQFATVYAEMGLNPAGIAIHRDGRIFLAAVGPPNSLGLFDAGSIVAVKPDGSDRQIIIPPSAKHVVDDLVFDDSGGFYMTDFRGSSTNPAGGVYYVSPDFRTTTAVLPGMCGANGVALSPDGKVLWATEFFACRLHRARLGAPATIARHGSSIPYHFVGPGADSMRTDSEGNVYVAMSQQGRVLVFSPYGIPIGHILLPGREDGRFLKCTSLALLPGSRDLFIVARDEVSGDAMVFKARGMADGFAMFSHQ